ncbi:MAG: BON domain-containing protein [Patescibacteria group bacterium]|nr:BON domain-containing protein [Patescibacteria group bacterium]MCL5113874.1 BON domain-containing protein [Patescibacteria group bacterium]
MWPSGYGFGGGGYGMGGYPPFWWGAPTGWTDLDLYDYNQNYVLDDNEIADLAKDNIIADAGIPMSDAHKINVSVSGGTATLSGTVRNPRTKPLAYGDAYWTPGVRDVVNDIEVQPMERKPEAPPMKPGRPTGTPTKS